MLLLPLDYTNTQLEEEEQHAVHRDWIVIRDPSKGLMQYTQDWSHT